MSEIDSTHWSVTVRHWAGGKLDPRGAVWHLPDVTVHGHLEHPHLHAALLGGSRSARDWQVGQAAGFAYMLATPISESMYTRVDFAQEAGLKLISETDPDDWYWEYITREDDPARPRRWALLRDGQPPGAETYYVTEYPMWPDARISEAG